MRAPCSSQQPSIRRLAVKLGVAESTVERWEMSRWGELSRPAASTRVAAHLCRGGRERGGLEPFPSPAESGLPWFRPSGETVELGACPDADSYGRASLLSPREVAELANVSRKTVYREIDRGALPASTWPPAADRAGRVRALP